MHRLHRQRNSKLRNSKLPRNHWVPTLGSKTVLTNCLEGKKRVDHSDRQRSIGNTTMSAS